MGPGHTSGEKSCLHSSWLRWVVEYNAGMRSQHCSLQYGGNSKILPASHGLSGETLAG